jgi:glycine cleavage system pyridoxal-binding protein P
VKKLLKDAHSHVSKAKLSAARSAVTHGNQTLKIAAERYGVDPERLKEALSGTKKRRKTTSVTDILTDIKTRHKGNYHSDKKVFKDILEKYEDGDISEEGVFEVLLHVQEIHKKGTKRVDEWLQRFEVLKGTLKATVK